MSCKLLVTGGREEAFAPAFRSGAASICLDLEDTVPAERKDAMRALLPEFLTAARAAGCPGAGVRVSSLGTPDGLKDVQLLLGCPVLPDVVVLTKIGSVAELLLFESLLSGRCAGIELQAIIETADGLNNAEAIALASRRLTGLAFGGKDLSAEMRMERAWEPMLYARSRVAHAAARAGIAAYDEPFHPRDDLEGLRLACLRVRALGYTGKSATDPRHAPVIAAAFG